MGGCSGFDMRVICSNIFVHKLTEGGRKCTGNAGNNNNNKANKEKKKQNKRRV